MTRLLTMEEFARATGLEARHSSPKSLASGTGFREVGEVDQIQGGNFIPADRGLDCPSTGDPLTWAKIS